MFLIDIMQNESILNKLTILIVDDNVQNTKLLGNILELEGYKIDVKYRGAEAIEHAIQSIPDLILLDILMPQMDGYETCEKLKENPKTKDIPIIFLSALTEVDNKIKGFQLGAVDYITKPFDSTEVLARVKTHLTIQKQRKELEELNATKDKFFSIIAHDLRNPFQGVMGLGEVVIENVEQLDKSQIKKYVTTMYRSTKDGYKLLENLLEWSRSQTGNIKFHQENISLKSIIHSNVKFAISTAQQKSITIEANIEEDILVTVDKNTVETIFRNLISNAIKFTPKNGEIKILIKKLDNMAEITISDTGIGIPQEDINKLFQINTKYTTYGTEKERGTGLGLILCKEFVEKNGGKIWVESVENQGSNFHFTLPLAS